MLMQKQLKNFKFLLLLICLILYNNYTLSSQTKLKPLVFHGGYTFSSFKGQKSAAIYITIINSGEKDVKINSISTNVAKKAEAIKNAAAILITLKINIAPKAPSI